MSGLTPDKCYRPVRVLRDIELSPLGKDVHEAMSKVTRGLDRRFIKDALSFGIEEAT